MANYGLTDSEWSPINNGCTDVMIQLLDATNRPRNQNGLRNYNEFISSVSINPSIVLCLHKTDIRFINNGKVYIAHGLISPWHIDITGVLKISQCMKVREEVVKSIKLLKMNLSLTVLQRLFIKVELLFWNGFHFRAYCFKKQLTLSRLRQPDHTVGKSDPLQADRSFLTHCWYYLLKTFVSGLFHCIFNSNFQSNVLSMKDLAKAKWSNIIYKTVQSLYYKSKIWIK